MPTHVSTISRRRFLAGSLAAGAGLLWPRPAVAAEPPVDPNRWALLADTHVWEHRDRLHGGVKPAENFALARRQILALRPRPAGVIITGDCVYIQGKPGDYAVLAEEVEPFRRAGLPVHFVLGNHDHRENFYRAFPGTKPAGEAPVPGKHVAMLPAPHANWFLLDSLQRTNYTPGRLGRAQLAWLAKALDARRDKPALLVMHHNPDPTGKSEGLQDTAALMEVLLARKNVKAYVFGHTHRWQLGRREGIHLINVPATAWLFDKAQPRGWLDVKLHPGGATLVLNSLDGRHPKHGETVELKWRR